MAFDGFTTRALQKELSEKLTGARIYRIVQSEADELLLTLRPEASRGGGQVRLLLCADATLPLVYLTSQNKPAPNTAPTFCMLLRRTEKLSPSPSRVWSGFFVLKLNT